MIRTINIYVKLIVVIAFMMVCVVGAPKLGGAADSDPVTVPGNGEVSAENTEKKKMPTLAELLYAPFVYKRENRPDPFMSFISQTVAVTPTSVNAVEEDVLYGMQLFEPGQLQLVAIVFQGKEGVALVQDSTGKGHLVKPGQKIGRRGHIKNILPNVVVIEEWSLNTAGKKRFKTINMVLRKEGEK